MGLLDAIFGSDDSDEDVSPEETADDASPDEESSEEVTAFEPLDPASYWAYCHFPFPLDWNRRDVETLAERADLDADRLVSNGREGFRIVTPQGTICLEVDAGSLPDGASIDLDFLPDDFPDEADLGHLQMALAEDGDVVNFESRFQPLDTAPDPWAEEGILRTMTRLVRQCLQRASTGVVRLASHRTPQTAREFLDASEGVDEPGVRSFTAWLEMHTSDDTSHLESAGLRSMGLPELRIRCEPPVPSDSESHEPEMNTDRWRRSREREALLYVASEMVHERRVPRAEGEAAESEADRERADDERRVPFGFGLEAARRHELEDFADEATTPYTLHLEEDVLEVRSSGPSDVWERWGTFDRSSSTMPPQSYHALFYHECQRTIDVETAPLRGRLPLEEIDDVDPIDLEIYAVDDTSSPTLAVSNGLGRQPGLSDRLDGEAQHVELAVQLAAEDFDEWVTDILLNSTAGFVLEDRTWRPGDMLEFEEPLHGLRAFVLDAMFDASPPRGPSIAVWQLVPLDEDEYDTVSQTGGVSWLDEQSEALDIVGRWRRLRR